MNSGSSDSVPTSDPDRLGVLPEGTTLSGVPKSFSLRYFEAWKAFPDASHKRMTSAQKQARVDAVLVARHLLATHLVADLHNFKPRPVFLRPPEVPDDDVEAWSAAQQVKLKGERAQQMDREAAAALGRWRAEVATAEAANSGMLVVLVEAVQAFIEIADPSNQASIDAIMTHLENVWHLDPYQVPLKGTNRRDLERWCDHACRRKDVCSSWLMVGGTPPRFSPRGYVGAGGHDARKEAPPPSTTPKAAPKSVDRDAPLTRPVWEDAISRLGDSDE